jgi:hypothetical protein
MALGLSELSVQMCQGRFRNVVTDTTYTKTWRGPMAGTLRFGSDSSLISTLLIRLFSLGLDQGGLTIISAVS